MRTEAKLCAVVKANAYGHGLPAVRALLRADEFAVATVTEAWALARFTDKPINVLSPPDLAEGGAYMPQIVPCIDNVECATFVKKKGATRVNIKVDTGMSRYGTEPKALQALLHAADEQHLRVKSVYSHLYSTASASTQFYRFREAVRPFEAYIPQKHILSGNFLRLPPYMHLDMVRAGYVLYGYGHPCVQPALRAETTVTAVKAVKKGTHIGYGEYTAEKDCVVAVLGAGYADGIRRMSDAPRYVEINGVLCKILGQVCMDATMVDVSGLDVHVGDKVAVIGDAYGIEAAAASCGTIGYEILTGFSGRAVREYVD